MALKIIAITKVIRESYKDMYLQRDGHWTEEIAPIAAFFDVETLIDGEKVIFEAEIRMGKSLQVDWSDEFQDVLMNYTNSQEDWNIITDAIFGVFENNKIDLPIKIGNH